MKHVLILAAVCLLFLTSCHDVRRTYTKSPVGIVITKSYVDGTFCTDTVADPSVKSLTDDGLTEHQAADLISQGVPASSTSSELTMLGWIVIIALVVIFVILMLATGNGKGLIEVADSAVDLID